jgi:hypothetical protein
MSDLGREVHVLTPDGGRVTSPEELPPVLAGLAGSKAPVTWIHADLGQDIVQALDDMGLDAIAVKSLRGHIDGSDYDSLADRVRGR